MVDHVTAVASCLSQHSTTAIVISLGAYHLVHVVRRFTEYSATTQAIHMSIVLSSTSAGYKYGGLLALQMASITQRAQPVV